MGREKAQNGWSSWFQAVGDRFLNVHFVVTAALIAFWMWALHSPISALAILYPKLASAPANSFLTEAIHQVAESAAAVSGLFTAVIGVVLGFYFGQRGVETAETAKRKAEETSEEVVEDYEGSSEELSAHIEHLTSELDLRDMALEEALDIIQEKGGEKFKIDEGSALDNLLHSDEEETEEPARDS